jgi:ABC-type antimicrobial peptide transport system permease subunit
VAIALVIGAPVGIAVGRTLYETFASDLSVVVTPVVSAPWTVGVVLATLAIGLLAALQPGRRSAREPAAVILRDE